MAARYGAETPVLDWREWLVCSAAVASRPIDKRDEAAPVNSYALRRGGGSSISGGSSGRGIGIGRGGSSYGRGAVGSRGGCGGVPGGSGVPGCCAKGARTDALNRPILLSPSRTGKHPLQWLRSRHGKQKGPGEMGAVDRERGGQRANGCFRLLRPRQQRCPTARATEGLELSGRSHR
jgi:hypothetical protein